MKRITALLLTFCLMACLFSACNNQTPTDQQEPSGDGSGSALSGAYLLSDLKNAPIGVVKGITDPTLVKEKLATEIVISFDSVDEAVKALKEKKVFAIALVKDKANTVLENNPDLSPLLQNLKDAAYVIPNAYSGEYTPDKDVLLRVDSTLSELRGNGGYDALVARYFTGDPDAVGKVIFNTADTGRVLTVGVSPDWKPFSYKNSAGDLVGFGVEIANAVAKKWKATIKFVEYPRDQLLKAASDEKVMLAIGPITETKDVPDTVAFSKPYYDETQMLILNDADAGKVPAKSDTTSKK
mgnify:CR=1 FL=1